MNFFHGYDISSTKTNLLDTEFSPSVVDWSTYIIFRGTDNKCFRRERGLILLGISCSDLVSCSDESHWFPIHFLYQICLMGLLQPTVVRLESMTGKRPPQYLKLGCISE
jgi:hypothetical protein